MPKAIKAYDTKIRFVDTLTCNGVAADLTGWTVKFLLKAQTSTVFSDDATIEVAASGSVSYEPGADFPTTPGLYQQEWEATETATGKVLTFPSDNYNKIRILPDLNEQ